MGGFTTFHQFRLKHLFVVVFIAGMVCGVILFAREQPIIANGVGSAIVMLIWLATGLGTSWWRASASVQCKPDIALGHVVANGAVNALLGNIAFFGCLSSSVWLEQTLWPDPLRDELGGPFTLLLLGGMCYGTPILLAGAGVGAMVWVTKCRSAAHAGKNEQIG